MLASEHEWEVKVDARKDSFFVDVTTQDPSIKPRYVENLLKKKAAKEHLGKSRN